MSLFFKWNKKFKYALSLDLLWKIAAAGEVIFFRLVGGVSIESESELKFLESDPGKMDLLLLGYYTRF